ncbi:kinase [Candidatus Syntrophocurvum alkaliphilum]|uniref:Kinase n=1 Tax=Candidatus Syntrophocurvum alkaliphilum TaxID=2293317 RepID=A0A6I6D9W5_9FIRM|nr:PfkB family carbohydrate kinase [Candidatus Syntrophocurvum alkaliphilum]QGT99648.1 kinase [Candidatus Syntrophocurvum alkaliphilum]
MRLTSREKEILDILKKEPLISQEELALRFNITRSSVAVHISNLMKKGVILGKGYVFNEEIPIVVIGESSLDIQVTQNDEDKIDIFYGGFANEVSKALTNLGAKVKIITLIGNDDLSTSLIENLQKLDVDLSNIYKHQHKRSSRKIIVNNVIEFSEGFLLNDYEGLLSEREWIAYNSEWLIIQPSFQEIGYKHLITKNDLRMIPSYCTCVYVDNNIQEISDILNEYSLVIIGTKNNEMLQVNTEKGIDMVEKGVRDVIITDGTNNIITINKKGVSSLPLSPNQEFNCKKQLHLFLAGIVYGLSLKFPMRQAIRMAVGLASSIDT